VLAGRCLKSVIERIDDLISEVLAARVGSHDCLTLFIREGLVSTPSDRLRPDDRCELSAVEQRTAFPSCEHKQVLLELKPVIQEFARRHVRAVGTSVHLRDAFVVSSDIFQVG
jgi:hypothetical protein